MSVLRRACRGSTTGGGHFYSCAHPWMNAALKTAGADWKIRTSRRWAFFGRACRNENNRSEVQAFGRGYGVAGNAVEIGDESTAKLSHLRKCVNFTAAVFNHCRTADIQVRLEGLVAPLMCILSCCQFRDEFIKSCRAVTDARAVTQNCIKTSGFTIVVHSEFFIALNGAGAGCETQQSNSRKRRPDYGAITKPYFHGKNLLDYADSLFWETSGRVTGT